MWVFFLCEYAKGAFVAWRGAACQRAGGGEAAVVFSPPAQTLRVRAGGRFPQTNAPIFQKFFFFFFGFVLTPSFLSGGERSGVQPHRASHPAAPQAGAGHRPGGGQHLRVLQRSLSVAAAAAAPLFLLTAAFSLTRPWLSWGGGTTPSRGISLPKCHYCLPKTVRGVKKQRSKRLLTGLSSVARLLLLWWKTFP